MAISAAARVAGWSARTIFLCGLALITFARLVVADHLELHFDEAYYWYWAQNLQLSYYDHPPMVAWLIRAGTAIAGDSELGVRFIGQVATFVASWLIFDAAERIYGDRAALLAGFAMQATLLLGAGSILMTPDAPLMFFLSVMIWALLRLCLEPRWYWWPIAGIAGGLAMLSKYTAALAALSVLLWLLTSPKVRRWIMTPWPWIALILAILCFSPVLIWNDQNGWISFGKQGGRLDWSRGVHPGYVLEFIGGQAGVITPLLFGLLIIAIWQAGHRALRDRNPVDTLLVSLFLVPAGFFLLQSPFMHVQANWPSVAWPAAFLALAALSDRPASARQYQRWLRWSVASGGALVALVWFYALSPDVFCLRLDPLRVMRGNRDFAGEVASLASRDGTSQIVVPDYATASILRFYAPKTLAITHVTDEPRYVGFEQPDIPAAAQTLILSRKADLPAGLTDRFQPLGSPMPIMRKQGGCTFQTYSVYRATRKDHG